MAEELAEEIEFDKLFYSRGGLYDFRHMQEMPDPKVQRKALITLVKFAQSLRPNLPDVYVNFIDNSKLGGASESSKGKFFIGIHAATIPIFGFLFDTILSSPNHLVNYGKSFLEFERPPLDDLPLGNIWHLETKLKNLITYSPVDKERAEISSFLQHLAMSSILYHEYAHIIAGHCSFFESIILQGKNVSDHVDPITYQTLEMDADSVATLRGIEYISYLFDKRAVPKSVKSFEDAIYLWHFAVYSMMTVVRRDMPKNVILEELKHPPFNLRQRMVMEVIGRTFEPNRQEDKMLELCVEAAIESEKAFQKLFLDKSPKEMLHKTYDKEYSKHMYKIVNNWKQVSPLLEPFVVDGFSSFRGN